MRQDDIRRQISGRAMPLPGNDIDTDRIIPARFLKCITFEGLEAHVFEDDRRQMPDHPFNQARCRGATILVVGQNFGCGSSREHAPEALRRWGIRGIVGTSFAEIFFGNCTAIGLPCLTSHTKDLAELSEVLARRPEQEIILDLENRVVQFGEQSILAMIPDGARNQLLAGTWNAMGVLSEAGETTDRVARSLPYVTGY
ncbi:isopropylmalate isomerase [Candidatus Methylomirabilis lanthanidiphila]|uniref:3-isopropylmalate dehydratase n=1 Tax=Candidatus Methylomirabilis lanthanidiphila TaxID=2211376 RepID=A0A564ZM63_9BACT|nr:3-isopropylmalate dehydratase small subunit [Candidatus Methylomirabilis lanthanidiphila]VUZ85947.1 isopropylmalate isomerase [Candidatus Methylomirabilis lanthanidiphila]